MIVFLMTVLLVVALVFAIGLLVRNELVFLYRKGLLQRLYVAASDDTAHGRYGQDWRYLAYEAVSYEQMLLHFWKPLDSFYPDKAFLEPRGGPQRLLEVTDA